ncbi:MAG: hypothetical protein M5U14_21815 [Acidimicrobiia bacterium]|nr:hypothetical protein [Acidimicrobiia bacterium]
MTIDLEAIRYPSDDDRAHRAGSDPDWQESFVLSWWDDVAGIGGFHRVAHEPNRGLGNVLSGVVTAAGRRFRRNEESLPLREGDRHGGAFGAAGHRVRFDGGFAFEVDEPECEMSLRFEDFYPLYNYWALTGSLSDYRDIGADHYQVAGRVVGEVRLGADTYRVDGLGHRDHSWGIRHWTALLGHRWLAGTVGPELSFSLITTQLASGVISRVGMAAIEGEVVPLSDVDVVVHLEPDGLTHRGGEGTGRLPGGEELRVESEVVDGIVVTMRGLRVVEGIGRARVGDRVGFCDLEQSDNPSARADGPLVALRAAVDDGLTSR